MERCPCCKARLKGAAICPRCQADLTAVISSEQSAQVWLSKAIQCWARGEREQSIQAVIFALNLKKTQMAVVFRDFLIQQYAAEVLTFLAQKHFLSANHCLYHARQLLPYSQKLQTLKAFTGCLLAKQHERTHSES